jgi:mannose-1-phosphate guanylyltransferase
MNPLHRKPNSLWSILLAGGEGERTRPFIERWLGRHKPKQYCTFVGTRSLFQHTVDRADRLSQAERRLVVAADSHREDVLSQMEGRVPGRILFQPENRGTVPGVFLPLTYVLAEDPEATVVVYPSDHFVYPEGVFLGAVADAVAVLERVPQLAILLGVVPDNPEPDYGWILPGPEVGMAVGEHRARSVARFLEKPANGTAKQAMVRGGLWNTLVIVAKATSLWSLGRQCFPRVMELFQWLAMSLDTAQESEVRESMYRMMPVRDFSKHLLQRVPEMLAVLELRGVLWSDWGRPERIDATLRQIGREPAFPVECVLAS